LLLTGKGGRPKPGVLAIGRERRGTPACPSASSLGRRARGRTRSIVVDCWNRRAPSGARGKAGPNERGCRSPPPSRAPNAAAGLSRLSGKGRRSIIPAFARDDDAVVHAESSGNPRLHHHGPMAATTSAAGGRAARGGRWRLLHRRPRGGGGKIARTLWRHRKSNKLAVKGRAAASSARGGAIMS